MHTHSVSKLFLPVIVIAAAQLCSASTITIDYSQQATAQLSSLDLSGVTVTPTGGQLQVLFTGGVSVVGGSSNNLIDGATESVKFSFDSGSATGVSFDDYYVVNLNPVLYGRPQGSVTGYAVGGASLGTAAILPFSTYPTTNVSALFGNVALSGFSVAGPQAGMQIAHLTFTSANSPVPEPSTTFLALAGTALLVAGARRRHAI